MMMKSIKNTTCRVLQRSFSAFLIFTVLAFSSFAQNANRTASTKIVDALNQLPADNQALYNRLMDDIVSTGEEGISMLLQMLERNDKSSVPAQYALSGVTAYVASIPSEESDYKDDVIKAYQDALAKSNDETVKGFLTRQLMVLGIPKAKMAQSDAPVTVKDAAKALAAAAKAAKKEPTELNTALRCKALSEYINLTGVSGGEKELMKAIQDPCREYRFAALYAIGNKASTGLYNQIGALLPKLKSDEAKVDVLWWMGETGSKQNLAYIKPFLKSDSLELVGTAARALAKIGEKSATVDVAALLSSNEADKVAIGEDCLKTYTGDVCATVVPLFTTVGTEGKEAIINLIAQRRSVENKSVVFDNLTSDNAAIAKASYNALKAVAGPDDLEKLYALLESADVDNVASIQDAVMAAIEAFPQADRYGMLVAHQATLSADSQNLYWKMIIASADVEQLYSICKDKNNPLAFSTLIDRIAKSKATGEQRLLQLRMAMEVAADTDEQNAVLKQVAGTKTFLGIIFAGQYIEVPQLQQNAAQAIRLVSADNVSFNGPEVQALLKRAAEVLTGPDAEYEITAINQHLEKLEGEAGFVSMFNGKDLTGWKGLTTTYKNKKGLDNPFARAKLTPAELAKAQELADEVMRHNWKVEDGHIIFFGKAYDNLCTVKKYGDFEMYLDWYLYPEGPEADAGIYLRGTPQVQIWDTARVNVGAQVGSGGLYNNRTNESKPLCVADNGLGQWNSFYIKMAGERVTVYLNGILVVDNVILENYWDRSKPVFPVEQIELQAHGSKVAYRNLYIRELPQVEPVKLSAEEQKDGFEMLFDGTSLYKWQGNKHDYVTEDGVIAVKPSDQGFGDLYTAKEYGDFVFRFEFKLTHGANNGLGIRAPGVGDAAYEGMEIQILDHYDAIYQPWLKDYQYHGSIYGIIPTQNRDALRPVGEWNEEEVYAKGTYIRVTLNGVVITEGDIAEATKNGTYDGKEHPGLMRPSGFIGFLGHGSELWIRNIRVKEL